MTSEALAPFRPPPIRRRIPLWFRILMVATLPLGITLAWAHLSAHFHNIIERLERPVSVLAIEGSRLRLGDGRWVALPEIADLTDRSSPLLAAALARGVEVGPGERLTVLLNIHHWCGNDPVRKHVARIDLSRLLLFTGLGVPAKELSKNTKECLPATSDFGPWGWRVGDFYQFQTWNELVEKGEVPLFAAK
jgi:hypothetical protein